MQLDSLAQIYSSKTNAELLVLAANPDSLVAEARPILDYELRRRALAVQPTPTGVDGQTWDFRFATVGKFFHAAGAFLLNLVIAVVGTAVIESEIWSLFGHARSPAGVLTKEWLLSPALAGLLGFYVNRRWRSNSAMWVWALPVASLIFGALLYNTTGSIWQHFLVANCLNDRSACIDFFAFTNPAIRTAFYSLAAWVSLSLRRR